MSCFISFQSSISYSKSQNRVTYFDLNVVLTVYLHPPVRFLANLRLDKYCKSTFDQMKISKCLFVKNLSNRTYHGGLIMIFRMLVDLTAFLKLLSIKSQNSSLTRIKISKYCSILSYKLKIPLFSFDQTYCVMKVT